MKVAGFLFISALSFVSCDREAERQRLKAEIIQAEKDFSKMSEDKGMVQAFIFYADRNVIKPRPDQQPIIGKLALIKEFKDLKPDYTLTWEPIKAEVSSDLGYTFGNYFLKTKTSDHLRDTTFYGNYISIWKRQSDGSWRFVFDTGNPTPGPTSLHSK